MSMKKQSIIFLIASLVAGVAGLCLSPFSPAFALAAVVWGVIYLILRFALWTPKSEWLPSLVFWLVAIAGMRVSVSWIFPDIRTGSAADWSLGLMFIGIVGAIVFGFRLLFLVVRARHSL